MPTDDYFANDPRTNLERMLAGDLYIADDPEIARRQQRAMRLAARYTAAYPESPTEARTTLTELLASVGEDVDVRPPLYVDYGSNISIGARTFVNYHLTALDVARITIGEDCQIGPNVQLLTPIHPVDPEPRRNKLEAAEPHVVADGDRLGGLELGAARLRVDRVDRGEQLDVRADLGVVSDADVRDVERHEPEVDERPRPEVHVHPEVDVQRRTDPRPVAERAQQLAQPVGGIVGAVAHRLREPLRAGLRGAGQRMDLGVGLVPVAGDHAFVLRPGVLVGHASDALTAGGLSRARPAGTARAEDRRW